MQQRLRPYRFSAFPLIACWIAASLAFGQSGQGAQQPSTLTTGSTLPSQGGSSIPIESTIYAYKSLSQSAWNLVDGLNTKKVLQDMTVVIATPTDLNNITMWQSALVQASLLIQRAESAKSATAPDYSKSGLSNTLPSGHVGELMLNGGFTIGNTLTNASNISTLVQTLASIFAVNQTVSPFTGSLTDLPLLNGVAGELANRGVSVLIPSLYTPNLLGRQSISGPSPLITDIKALEDDRKTLVDKLGESKFQENIALANTVISVKTSSDEDKGKAQVFLQQAAQYVGSLMSVIQSIDLFEATLFGGQMPAATGAPNQTPQPASQQAAQTPPAPGPGPGSANPPQPGAGSGGPQSPASNPLTSLWPAPPTFSGGNGSIFPQLLATDLLMQTLPANCQNAGAAGQPSQCPVRVLVVKTLESGGSQYAKSNAVLGSKAGFSGGAIVTFGLYDVSGRPLCAGRSSGWYGFKLTEDFQASIPVKSQDPAVPDNNRASSDLEIGCYAVH